MNLDRFTCIKHVSELRDFKITEMTVNVSKRLLEMEFEAWNESFDKCCHALKLELIAPKNLPEKRIIDTKTSTVSEMAKSG